jgi:glycosyltransferase involved in cell wall biosynthesis
MDDNLPLTGLEALACGKPVVGFEVGGIPDIVRPGTTGLLAPPQDARALGKAIGEVLQDPTRLRAMEEQCRAVALQDYSLERQARRYLELYNAILAETGRPAQHA